MAVNSLLSAHEKLCVAVAHSSNASGRGHHHWHVTLQAGALLRLCGPLSLAERLRELELDLRGRATDAVSAKLAKLGDLTQLDSLQLRGIAIAGSKRLSAALSPMTRLSRLLLRFDDDHWMAAQNCTFPWQSAVCGLTNLQELRVTSASESDYSCLTMFQGALPAAVSQLSALRHLEVLGMTEPDEQEDSDRLLLSALPALETASLRLHTLAGQYPGLHQQRVVLNRLVSLSLALRWDIEDDEGEPYQDTRLPVISAPALTELTLDDTKLAPDSEQLSWLPQLPKLQRLVLKDVKTASSQLPSGVMACSGLTELVLERVLVSFSNKPDEVLNRPECRLRSLPAAAPCFAQLVHLSLSRNAFSAVPPALSKATALQVLDLAKQKLRDSYVEQHSAAVQGLRVLNNLTRLRCLNLEASRKRGLASAASTRPTRT